jgi:hypothetical protein
MDREPISIGVIPNVAPNILTAVVSLGKKIHQIIENVNSHKEKCHKLVRHVQEIVGNLQYLYSVSPLSQQLERALEDLGKCLWECFIFLRNFVEVSKFKKILVKYHHKKKFEDLNKELTECNGRLLFGMIVHEVVTSAQEQRSINTQFMFRKTQTKT